MTLGIVGCQHSNPFKKCCNSATFWCSVKLLVRVTCNLRGEDLKAKVASGKKHISNMICTRIRLLFCIEGHWPKEKSHWQNNIKDDIQMTSNKWHHGIHGRYSPSQFSAPFGAFLRFVEAEAVPGGSWKCDFGRVPRWKTTSSGYLLSILILTSCPFWLFC